MTISTKPGIDSGADWRTAPVAGFNGPANDDALLPLMMQKAHFKHLWELGGLAVVDSYGTREAAVGALARELAYFTGKDHQRMFELLQNAKLVTDDPVADDVLAAIVRHAVAQATDVLHTDSSMTATAAASVPVTTGLAQTQNAAQRLAVLAKNKFKRHAKTDEIKAVFSNCVIAIAQPKVCGIHVGYDEFVGAPWIVREKPGATLADREELEDGHYDDVRFNLEKEGFEYTNEGDVKKAIRHIGNINRHDSAKTMLNSLVWDGNHRVDTFVETYFGAKGGDYAREVGRYMWTAMAGRILFPGVQADMTPVLIGDAGLNKTKIVEALVPESRMCCKIDLKDRGPNLARLMTGCTVGLIDELKGLNTGDRESILSFLTDKEENWVPKFVERGKRYKRRIFFVATSNPKSTGFIEDAAVARRLLPIVVVKACDPALIQRDLLQLYAEGRELYLEHGVLWQQAEALARIETERFKKRNTWLPSLTAWLTTVVAENSEKGIKKGERGSTPFTTAEVANGALNIETKLLTDQAERKICDGLRELGYTSRQVTEKTHRPYKWFRPEQMTEQDSAELIVKPIGLPTDRKSREAAALAE